jgi:hypothetical protein
MLDSELVVYGLHSRPGSEDDTIHIAPRAVRSVSFSAGEPGAYYYWGTTTHSLDRPGRAAGEAAPVKLSHSASMKVRWCGVLMAPVLGGRTAAEELR